jgi:hypothetical protein
MNTVPFPIAAILIAAYIIMPILVVRCLLQTKTLQLRIIFATSLLYFVGEGLQFCGIGPAWVRHHMSDAGIVSAVGAAAIILYGLKLSTRRVMVCRYLCWGSLLIFLIYELLQFRIGKGDTVDTIVYHIGFFIAYGSFWTLERKWHIEDQEYAQAVMAAAADPSPRRKGPRHTAPKRKR